MITGARIHTHGEVEVENGVCSGGHPLSAQAGVRVMEEGGNAIDALVAGAFTACVTEQASCGIGGYGHISLWLADPGVFVTIDAYCRAPLKAHAKLFKLDARRPPTYYGHPYTKGDAAFYGMLAPAVPGAVAGFVDAHALGGKLPLAQVLAPAIEAAEAGVPLRWDDKHYIVDNHDRIAEFSATAAHLLPGGKLPAVPDFGEGGHVLDTHMLARALKDIARRGKAGFYRGRVAKAIDRFMAKGGGILSADDLAAYRPRILREQPARYRGHDYIACYDQVAYEALNILDRYDLRGYGPDSYEYRHLMAEALALAFTDSITHYGDPDFVKSPVDGLANPAFAAKRQKEIRMRRALARPIAAGDPWPYDASGAPPEVIATEPQRARRAGTSMFAAADRAGNMASVCMSVGSGYGSLVYVPEAGIFLNNAMQNYDPRPGFPSSIAPGKMPIFAAPAIVATKAGRAVYAASGSGGYHIETGVLHTMINLIDHRMKLQNAVNHPRVHSQGGPTHVDPRIAEAVRARLAKAGHEIELSEQLPVAMTYGRTCAVAANPRRGTLTAAAGPSWTTSIAGF